MVPATAHPVTRGGEKRSGEKDSCHHPHAPTAPPPSPPRHTIRHLTSRHPNKSAQFSHIIHRQGAMERVEYTQQRTGPPAPGNSTRLTLARGHHPLSLFVSGLLLGALCLRQFSLQRLLPAHTLALVGVGLPAHPAERLARQRLVGAAMPRLTVRGREQGSGGGSTTLTGHVYAGPQRPARAAAGALPSPFLHLRSSFEVVLVLSRHLQAFHVARSCSSPRHAGTGGYGEDVSTSARLSPGRPNPALCTKWAT